MTVVRVDFIADFACPWCYVAWRALDKAIVARPDLTVERSWGAYMLRPDTPPQGFDRKAYMAKIFAGQPERAQASRAALETAAADAGAVLHLDRAEVLPATADAHRLIHWADGQQLGLQAIDALFAAYHVDGRNIGDKDVLADIAAEVGLDRTIVVDLLRGEADWGRVASAHNAAVDAGIRGVPVTLFNGKFARQGCETVAIYTRLLDQAAAEGR